jgi:hypothetical protein
MNEICRSCETVAWCSRHGCLPEEPLPRAREAMSWPEKALIGVIAAVLLLFCAWVAWLVFANWHQIVAFMPY